jgi:predicted nucleic acid-binding protein
MTPYADTNLFTRLYLDLPEARAADRLVAAARSGKASLLPVIWLHRIELANAFEFSVWLGRQPGHPAVTPQQAAAAWATFREDIEAETFLQPVRPDLSALEASFEDLSHRHTARHGFRTCDLLHVAAARTLGCDAFWSFDERARKLAALEGLSI